ncbi:MAG: hypothetical protein RL186_321 [Pseudomonadota bacterium]|jgi:hypothetical protein
MSVPDIDKLEGLNASKVRNAKKARIQQRAHCVSDTEVFRPFGLGHAIR